MPIREMLHYAALRDRGPVTEAERRELLVRHREQVRAQLAELSESLLVLDAKIAGYAGISKRMNEYDALPERRKRPATVKRAAARW